MTTQAAEVVHNDGLDSTKNKPQGEHNAKISGTLNETTLRDIRDITTRAADSVAKGTLHEMLITGNELGGAIGGRAAKVGEDPKQTGAGGGKGEIAPDGDTKRGGGDRDPRLEGDPRREGAPTHEAPRDRVPSDGREDRTKPVEAPRLRDLSPEEQKRLDDDATKYGVKYERTVDKDGKESISYYYEGKGKEKVEVGKASSIEEGEKMLEKQQKERIESIENRYHVHLSRDGEKRNYDNADRELRAPGIGELAAVEEALSKVQPGQFTKSQREALENGKPVESGTPLNLDFVKDPVVLKGYSQPISFYLADDKTPRTILQYQGQPYEDQVYTTIHELNHNQQAQMGAFQNEEAYAAKFGMHHGEKDGKKTDEWVLDGKEPGEYYKRDWSPENAAKNVWIKTDAKGNVVLDKDGKPTIISNDEAQERARITPPTGYFPNPIENGADAETKYVQDKESREKFLQQSPQLYEAIKAQDQAQLDKFYGKNSDGSSKFVRLPDGTVAPNNAENQQQILAFEKEARSKKSELPPMELSFEGQKMACCGGMHS